jgi:sirohydrochlorin ferrochelatase
MKGLLIVAHGSRRQSSNDEVRGLVNRLRADGKGYQRIGCAFLELAEPSIPDGLRALVEAGCGELVVLPYFLAAGRHVVTDIPAEIAPVREEYPGVDIRLAPYLGSAPGIARLLLAQAGIDGAERPVTALSAGL